MLRLLKNVVTQKQNGEMYLEHRKKDVTNGYIVSGRYTTIATHLKHWLNFIGKDATVRSRAPQCGLSNKAFSVFSLFGNTAQVN